MKSSTNIKVFVCEVKNRLTKYFKIISGMRLLQKITAQTSSFFSLRKICDMDRL